MKFRNLTLGDIVQYDDGRIVAFFFVPPELLKTHYEDTPLAEICVEIPSKEAPVEEYSVSESPIRWDAEAECYESDDWRPSEVSFKTLEKIKDFVLRRLV